MSVLRLRVAPASASDRGELILGWLVKLTLTLAVLGTLAVDAISIVAARAAASDDGAFAAREAALVWRDTHDVFAAFDRAVATAEEKNLENRVRKDGFRIDPDGTVHLRMNRTAKTWVVARVDPIARWAQITQKSSAGTGP